jgi:hypothetical protein
MNEGNPKLKSLKLRSKIKSLKFPKLNTLKHLSKRYFLLWILYQTVKGILTTSLIWIPLIYATFFKK